MRPFRCTLTRITTALLLAAGLSAPALAQSNAQGLLDNRFVAKAGAFLVGTDIRARLNGQSAENPEIDFDETFGKAEDSTRARVDLSWRMNARHLLRFMYFDNSNSRTKTIDRDVAWGDYVFQADAVVTSEFEARTYELAYEYAFVRAPSYEVAATLGVHATDLLLSLSASGGVTGPGRTRPTGATTETGDAFAPLPVIGLRGGWVVAPNWYIDAQAQFFALNSGGFDGRWSDVRVGATWMFHKNFGLGLGFNGFALNLDVDKTSFNGSFKLTYAGLQAYLTGTF